MEFFSDNMIVTYDDVLKAEEDFKPETPLSKPNPFVFLKAAFRNELDDEKLISGNYDKEMFKNCCSWRRAKRFDGEISRYGFCRCSYRY